MKTEPNKMQWLLDFLAKHQLKIDGWHGGAGKLRDLEIGVGEPLSKLLDALQELKQRGHGGARLTQVDNPDHPQHGQLFLQYQSCWWEE